MSKIVELKIDMPITAAVKRLMGLMSSGYLPDQMQRDLDTVTRAALGWEMYTKKETAP